MFKFMNFKGDHISVFYDNLWAGWDVSKDN